MRHHVVTGAAEPATARGGQLGLGARGVRPTLGCQTKFCVSTLLADQVIDQAASFPLLAQSDGWRTGRACPLCPGSSDINLFRYRERIIHLDAKVPDRTLDLSVSEQKLDGSQVAGTAIDQTAHGTSATFCGGRPLSA
jgi:hypothetical protein